MNDEIKEILEYWKFYINEPSNYKLLNVHFDEIKKVLDYITNLQQENEKLKEKLNCKEYFSSTMPKDTEFVILTKNNYDRQQKDIQLELINYKSRVEKAVKYYKRHQQECVIGRNKDDKLIKDYYLPARCSKVLLNILQNGSDE